ncbi:hypothetical protein KU6B_36400 [Mameliella alba]|uniref:hypothetical protein n=1 Tax=Mameliella alba TaxID=561184 RepID=UPI0013E51A8C|nr:hypothetical protein [Mameliella alba]BBU57375.1 hypothetical protein KU6B_36400 [Mameliella alba]
MSADQNPDGLRIPGKPSLGFNGTSQVTHHPGVQAAPSLHRYDPPAPIIAASQIEEGAVYAAIVAELARVHRPQSTDRPLLEFERVVLCKPKSAVGALWDPEDFVFNGRKMVLQTVLNDLHGLDGNIDADPSTP